MTLLVPVEYPLALAVVPPAYGEVQPIPFEQSTLRLPSPVQLSLTLTKLGVSKLKWLSFTLPQLVDLELKWSAPLSDPLTSVVVPLSGQLDVDCDDLLNV